MARQNIILIGFSTTGKSSLAPRVAQHLGWEGVDTDEEVVKLAGKPIPQIFAQEGEGHFRGLERQVLERACSGERKVIAAGGGAILDPGNRQLLQESGMVVLLEAQPQTIYQRLLKDTENQVSPNIRPLLAGADPLERIQSLKAQRQPLYSAIAGWTVHTDNLTEEEVASEVVRGWQYWSRSQMRGASWGERAACEVITPTQRYPIFIGWGILPQLGQKMKEAGLSGTCFLLSDEQVFSLYGSSVVRILKDAGFKVASLALPPGEATKSPESAAKIYDFLVEHRAERKDCVVALGGGMVGDLAGFVAATYLRGLALLQVPTSLVGMVDASIGGKVAVNHPQGKNLIGAFYQPRFVLSDVQTLTTLPRRELISGWSEVVKHGAILDIGLFQFLEANKQRLSSLEPDLTAQAVARSATVKARLVSEDEKETGRRILLNYGHTIGHGLEAATAYTRFLHGEAVAIGMMGAAEISRRLALIPPQIVKRQEALLQGFGLPIRAEGVNVGNVLRAMELDKKVREQEVRWVLLEGLGKATVRQGVPQEVVKAVLEGLLSKS